MLPWSVMPRAGCPSATAAATASPTRLAPSSIENSVWVCRWVNDRPTRRLSSASVRLLHRRWMALWRSYTLGIPTIGAPGGALKGSLQVGPGTGPRVPRGPGGSGREALLADLLQLGPGGHLLGEEGGL